MQTGTVDKCYHIIIIIIVIIIINIINTIGQLLLSFLLVVISLLV